MPVTMSDVSSDTRQFVLSILKVAWESPIHQDVLKGEAK